MSVDVGHLLFHASVVIFEIFAGVLAALLVHGWIKGNGRR